MGSLNKSNTNLHTNSFRRIVRSKGERLGWASIFEQKKRPLKEIVGEGEKVNPSEYSLEDTSIKLLMP